MPYGVELCTRFSPTGNKVLIVINHNKTPQSITLPKPMHELLTDKTLTTINLPTQGVVVLPTESSQ
jgi:beta-galactosidase